MPRYTCKHCGREFVEDNEGELVEKAHAHLHLDHGKHASEKKIRRSIRE